jgi:hypothetical protein
MEPNHDRRKTALETVFRAWNLDKVRYAVAHGVERYPDSVGRDIDVLIASGDVRRALDSARKNLETLGYQVVRPPNLWGERLIGVYEKEWDSAVEIHSIERLLWRNIVLSNHPDPTATHHLFAIDPWISFVKRILSPLLANDTRRFVARNDELVLSAQEESAVQKMMPDLCGAELTSQLLDAVRSRDPERLRQCAPRLQKAMTRRAFVRTPGRSLLCVADRIWRRLRQPLAPCAPVIVLVAPYSEAVDGMLRLLCDSSPSFFTKVIVHGLNEEGAPRGIFRFFRKLRWNFRDRIDASRQRVVVYHVQDHPAQFASDLTVFLRGSEGSLDAWARVLADSGESGEMAREFQKLILEAFLKKLRKPANAGESSK